MKIRLCSLLMLLCCIVIFAGCDNLNDTENNSNAPQVSSEIPDLTLDESTDDSTESTEEIQNANSEGSETDMDVEENPITQNALGGLSPEDALEYMKNTENLIIIDVATAQRYESQHFEGAVNVPIESIDDDEEKALYMEIPAGQPVILHCRLGMIVPGAYNTFMELRPDVPEVSYIAGAPPFDEYNTWIAQQQ